MDVLTFLGIYRNAIENIIETCEDAVGELRDAASRYGYEADTAMISAFNLSDAARDILRETIDVDDFTNSIISAYLTAMMQLIKDTAMAKEFGIDAEIYVNCDDSHLYIKTDSTTYTYSDGVIESTADECFLRLYGDKVFEMINEHLRIFYNIPKGIVSYKDFESDIDDGYITVSDIYESANNDKLTDEIIRYVNDVANSI